MATLVLRTVKGTPLTNSEVDGNFSNILTDVGIVSSNIGVLSNLTTVNKSNIVIAVNELETEIGPLASLTTTNKGNIVFAVNELKSNVGVLSNLTTTNKSNLVIAVNEINENSGVSAATYGSSTNIPVIVVSSKGKITSASNVAIVTGTTITDDTTTNSTYYIAITSASSGSINTANVSTTKLTFNPASGLLTSTDYNSSSDIALKENFTPISNPLDIISQLTGFGFSWKDSKERSYGLSAQDVEKVLPDIVRTRPDGFKGINYLNLTALLIEAVKELKQEIQDLKKYK